MKLVFYLQVLIFLLLLLSTCSFYEDESNSVFDDKLVMVSDSEVAAYAIPNIIATPKGSILCLATARYGDNHDWGNIQKIALSRSFDEGKTWEEPKIIASIPNWTIRQTSAVVDPETNKIIIFGHKSPRFNDKGERISETWNIAHPEERKEIGAAQFIIESNDEGETWSEIKEIDLPYWPHDPGISLKYSKYKGRLVVPARTNKGTVFDWNNLFNGVLLSDDHGKTWRAGGLTQSHVGEACVVELSDGRVHVNSRNHADNFGIRNHAISSDGGDTFTEFGDDPQLIEPTCDAGLVRFSDPDKENIILFSNPAVKATKRWDAASRRRMSVKASYDNCKTWPITKLIYSGPTAYSGLTSSKNMIFLVYERAGLDSKDSRENIAVARFNKEWLTQPELEPPVIQTSERVFKDTLEITFNKNNTSQIKYTLDGSNPTNNSPFYSGKIIISNDVSLKAISITKNNKSIITQARFYKSKLSEPNYQNDYNKKYSGAGSLTLVDGINGGLNFNDGRWQGFEKNDFEVIIDLEEIKSIQNISINFLQTTDFWIFFPKTVSFKVSKDNNYFKVAKTIINNESLKNTESSIQTFQANFKDLEARFVKIIADNIGICLKWHKSAGGDAWLFTDEIIIN